MLYIVKYSGPFGFINHRLERTEIRGYLYDFETDAPNEIVELGLTAGFGRENSWGMGWCERVKYNKV